MSKRHIAVLCDYELLPDRIGGMDAFFWVFEAKCEEEGITVDWFFPNTAAFGRYSQMNIFPKGKASIEQTFLAHCQINSPNYTHLFTHFLELCTPFFKAAKKATQATIIAVDHNPRPLGGYPLKKRIKKRIKGNLYGKYTDVFVGVSNYTVQELIKDFGSSIKKRSITIYNGVVISEIEVRKQRAIHRPKFLVASHLRQSKGIQDLIAAVALLPQQLRGTLTIDMYGDGPYKHELMEQISNRNLEKQFRFQGSTDILKQLFSHYDYLLHPTHMECFSLTLLESLAANVPVVTTPVGGNTEVVRDGENGFLFEARNSAQLALLLEQICTGQKKISGNTRTEIADRFTIEAMVARYLNLLT